MFLPDWLGEISWVYFHKATCTDLHQKRRENLNYVIDYHETFLSRQKFKILKTELPHKLFLFSFLLSKYSSPEIYPQSHCLKTKNRFLKGERLPSHIHILRPWCGLFSIVNTYIWLKEKLTAPSIIIIQKNFQGHKTAKCWVIRHQKFLPPPSQLLDAL